MELIQSVIPIRIALKETHVLRLIDSELYFLRAKLEMIT